MTKVLMSRPATRVVAAVGERCDRCGAAARLRATLHAGSELAFCGHHANKHADRIVEVAGAVAVESGFAWRGASLT